MRIVYHGNFLGYGLQALGHEVHTLKLCEDGDINQLIRAACPNPDLTLIELWGDMPLPLNLHECATPLAAYAIDAPLNEYWLANMLRVFDYAFVDQHASAVRLRSRGIRAAWLPLCVPEGAFRAPRPKRYGISFVGRVDGNRSKRRNLLRHIQTRFPLNMAQGVSTARMQDIFAESAIVLNENLFKGQTLRIFQGLASGSLVFTEAEMGNPDPLFQHNRHLLCYSPHDVLDKLDDVLSNPERYAHIAAQGQEACRSGHTATVRAAQCLDIIADQAPAARPRDRESRFLLAEAGYLQRMRYGGSYARIASALNELARGTDAPAAGAARVLGDMCARMGRKKEAEALYAQAGISPALTIKQGLLRIADKDKRALAIFHALLPSMPGRTRSSLLPLFAAALKRKNPFPTLLFLAARCQLALGRGCDVGFAKQIRDEFPDTALETAFLAWEQEPSPELLEFMLRIAAANDIEGEMLPCLLSAIKQGAATDRQIARAAELAMAHYDKECAAAIIHALSGTKSHTH